MTRDEILKAFAELSAEDWKAVQEGIVSEKAGGKEGTGGPADMTREIMGKLQEGGDPHDDLQGDDGEVLLRLIPPLVTDLKFAEQSPGWRGSWGRLCGGFPVRPERGERQAG